MTTANAHDARIYSPPTPGFTYVHPSPNYVFGYEEDYAQPGHSYPYTQPRDAFDTYSRDLIEYGFSNWDTRTWDMDLRTNDICTYKFARTLEVELGTEE